MHDSSQLPESNAKLYRKRHREHPQRHSTFLPLKMAHAIARNVIFLKYKAVIVAKRDAQRDLRTLPHPTP